MFQLEQNKLYFFLGKKVAICFKENLPCTVREHVLDNVSHQFCFQKFGFPLLQHRAHVLGDLKFKIPFSPIPKLLFKDLIGVKKKGKLKVKSSPRASFGK